MCPIVHKGWTVELWQEIHVLGRGVDTWEEALAIQPSPDSVYQGEVIKCIEANQAELETNGERYNQNKSDIWSLFTLSFILGEIQIIQVEHS